jgi:hypothetical protein
MRKLKKMTAVEIRHQLAAIIETLPVVHRGKDHNTTEREKFQKQDAKDNN